MVALLKCTLVTATDLRQNRAELIVRIVVVLMHELICVHRLLIVHIRPALRLLGMHMRQEFGDIAGHEFLTRRQPHQRRPLPHQILHSTLMKQMLSNTINSMESNREER